MKFFSGFSLQKEEYLFSEYIEKSEYTVCGFSYGAIKALNLTLQKIENSQRVDRLQLFSPAFFQTKSEKFKRLQIMSYNKNSELYLRTFMKGCFSPYEEKIVENSETNVLDLKELLEYEWSIESLRMIESNGVKIEVYLGSKDSIIDVKSAREFFLQIATVTYVKDANHFLQTN